MRELSRGFVVVVVVVVVVVLAVVVVPEIQQSRTFIIFLLACYKQTQPLLAVLGCIRP